MAAAAMVVAHARGLFELDEPVATYWPEFAQAGKSDITVRQLLSHQAGLVALDQRVNAEILADFDRLAEILARQSPAWQPGSRHGYHTLTLGWYQSELIRRVDPQKRSLGKFFLDEVAKTLDSDFYIGLPSSMPEQQLAVVDGFHRLAMLGHLNSLPPKMVLSGIWPKSLVARSVRCLRVSNPAQIGERGLREIEVPSANGFGNARALARIYDSLASGGHELGLPSRTRNELFSPPQMPGKGSYDAILKIDTNYKLGFSRPSRDMGFGHSARAFGCPGAGGSFAMGDPDAELGFAYVTNQMGFRLFDDPREKAVREACYRCVSAMQHHRRIAC
jgi:CubicO group peptidase (beta-lactamase class C family)